MVRKLLILCRIRSVDKQDPVYLLLEEINVFEQPNYSTVYTTEQKWKRFQLNDSKKLPSPTYLLFQTSHFWLMISS